MTNIHNPKRRPHGFGVPSTTPFFLSVFSYYQRPDPSTKMRPANLSHPVNFHYLCNHTSHSQMASGFHVVLAFPVAMMRKAFLLPWNPLKFTK